MKKLQKRRKGSVWRIDNDDVDQRRKVHHKTQVYGLRVGVGRVLLSMCALMAYALSSSCAFGQPQQDAAPSAEKQPAEPTDAGKSKTGHRIDTTNVKLSGADLYYEVVGKQLILKGNQADLDLVDALITVLEDATEVPELRVITVTRKDANDIASTVGPALRKVLYDPNIRSEHEVSVTALSSNIILISALPRHIDFAVQTILQVDEVVDTLGQYEQLVFTIKHRQASEVADELRDILGKLKEKTGAQGPKGEIQIIPNNANNTILVIAPESDRLTIQNFINTIDVEPAKGWGEVKLTVFPLLHSKPEEMSKVITDLLATEQGQQEAAEVIFRLSISKAMPDGSMLDMSPIDLGKPMRIIAHAGTNSLIIATVEENVGPMSELIRMLDGVAISEEVDVQLFPLRFADAETVRDVLRSMFDDGKTLPEDPDGSGNTSVPQGDQGKALSYNIGIGADARTNTLIISGRPEQLQLAEVVINKLDQPSSTLKFPIRFVQLEYTDASRVGDIIKDLFAQRLETAQTINAGQVALARDDLFLTVDMRSNSLIVSASEENFAEIEKIVRQLDTKPAKLFDQIRIVKCDRLSAKNMKEKIDELWQRKASLRQNEELLEDTPILVADGRSNSLVVASSVEDFEEIRRLIKRLEAQPLIEDTRIFKLTFADTAVLAGMLEELFQGMEGASESFTAPTVIADSRSNALLVAGTRDSLERAAEIIPRLDVKAGPNTAAIRVYPLHHGSAIKLAPRMQELFDSRSEGQDVASTPVVLLADEATNTVVGSASRDDHEIIVELLQKLDQPSTLAKQFQIFPLKMAKAAPIAEKLESLFQSQGSEGRADVIAIEIDERINALIVWASQSEMDNISNIITRLDSAKPVLEMKVKVIQLRQALAEDFADVLEQTLIGEEGGEEGEEAIIITFDEKQPDGTYITRKLLRQDIRIQPDPRTNSLMVMAPAESMDMLESMILDFDRVHPIRSELRLFQLINADAETMVDRLEELFQTDGGEDGPQSQIQFGMLGEFEIASVGQDLRFTADVRTNTLIAAGAEVDLRMVESLVQYLDAQEAEVRVVEVMQTNYREASQIADAYQNFIQQEEDVYGDIDDEEAQRRRMERQVSIEAIGDEEGGTSHLMIGASRGAFEQTMDMIQRLDQPEPQVMISVVIAEITQTDDLELGIEIAGQDLHFSEEAIVGPNGIIQGSDFDFVSGTDLGAAGLGLGGFNFTITGADFSFLFRALQQESRLEVLSRPALLVRNGEEGSITIADEVPIVESSRLNDTGQTQSTIGREDVGIVLTATPQISPDGYVTIALTQEISNIGENIVLTEGVASPIFQTREVVTNVTVRDGETVIIGGLIQKRVSRGVNKVPILGDLPYIGVLFRSMSSSESKTELVVVMTVDILRTDEDLHDMSIEERDNADLPDWLRQSPLMKSLRIMPEDSAMGPEPVDLPLDYGQKKPTPQKRQELKQYGPKPKTYGPIISRPEPVTRAERAVYGPRILSNQTLVQDSRQ